MASPDSTAKAGKSFQVSFPGKGELETSTATTDDGSELVSPVPREAPSPPEQAEPCVDTSAIEDRRAVVPLSELLTIDIKPRGSIVWPWLPEQGLAMIYGPRGVGKTYVGLSLGLAIAYRDSDLLPQRWRVSEPQGVLYLDGEMPLSLLQERVRELLGDNRQEPARPFNIYSPELDLEQPPPDLGTAEGQRFVEQHLSGVKVIIVDHISALCKVGVENEGESWLPVQSWALKMRSRGCSVIFLHHAGKQGTQRGTSRREDVLDTVISLRKPDRGNPEDGATFEVHYEKTRAFYGKEAQPFLMKLDPDDNRMTWRTEVVETAVETVAGFLSQGLTQSEIVVQTGLSKGYVSKLAKQARNEGLTD